MYDLVVVQEKGTRVEIKMRDSKLECFDNEIVETKSTNEFFPYHMIPLKH